MIFGIILLICFGILLILNTLQIKNILKKDRPHLHRYLMLFHVFIFPSKHFETGKKIEGYILMIMRIIFILGFVLTIFIF